MIPTLKRIPKKMKATSPVFIVGPPRSGTSLLYRVLQKHTSFRLGQPEIEYNLVESKAFLDPNAIYSLGKERANPGFAYMLYNEQAYDNFVRDTRRVRSWQTTFGHKIMRILSRHNIFTWDRRRIWRFLKYDTLIQTYFYYAQIARGTQRITEKTPKHLLHIPEIQTTFPFAKFLCIFRHPVDVYSSYKRRLRDQEKFDGATERDLKWLELPVESFLQSYETDLGIALNESENSPVNFKMIQYERFTRDPVNEFSRICKFINEPFEEECLHQRVETENTFTGDPYLFKEITQNTKDWQEFIDEEETKKIEDRLEWILEKLNYDRYT